MSENEDTNNYYFSIQLGSMTDLWISKAILSLAWGNRDIKNFLWEIVLVRFLTFLPDSLMILAMEYEVSKKWKCLRASLSYATGNVLEALAAKFIHSRSSPSHSFRSRLVRSLTAASLFSAPRCPEGWLNNKRVATLAKRDASYGVAARRNEKELWMDDDDAFK